MEPHMFFYSDIDGWPPKQPGYVDMFRQIHDTAYEMTAAATSADAKFLGYLLIMVATEAERLSATDAVGALADAPA